MNWDWLDMSLINWPGVGLATLAAFVVGALWYSKLLFMKPWMKRVGLTEKDVANTDGMVVTYVITGLSAAVAAAFLSILMSLLGVSDVVTGAVFGLVVGVAFRLTAHLIHNGFARRGHTLSLIDGAHDAVALAAAGAIIAAFI